MDRSVGLLMIVFIVAVSGQDVLPKKEEVQIVEQHQAPSSNEVASMINTLAMGIQGFQKMSTVHQAPDFLCMWCEQLMTMAYNMTVDKGLLDLVQTFMRQYACTYWVPAGFKTYCDDYVDEIPDLIIAFANTYLNPNNCALICNSQGMNQQLNVLSGIVKMMDGASKKDISK